MEGDELRKIDYDDLLSVLKKNPSQSHASRRGNVKVAIEGRFDDLGEENRKELDGAIRIAAIRNEMLEVRLTDDGTERMPLTDRVRMVSDYIEAHHLRAYFGPVLIDVVG